MERVDPPLAGDEAATILGFLEFFRGTVAWKCAGLDGEALATRHPPSTMTLGGLLKHLARVEDQICSQWLMDNPPAQPSEPEPDWDWSSAELDSPEQLRSMWDSAVERSRTHVTSALADRGLDGPALGYPGATVRWILFTMIEAYTRHSGHADLLRENIDGLTGE